MTLIADAYMRVFPQAFVIFFCTELSHKHTVAVALMVYSIIISIKLLYDEFIPWPYKCGSVMMHFVVLDDRGPLILTGLNSDLSMDL